MLLHAVSDDDDDVVDDVACLHAAVVVCDFALAVTDKLLIQSHFWYIQMFVITVVLLYFINRHVVTTNQKNKRKHQGDAWTLSWDVLACMLANCLSCICNGTYTSIKVKYNITRLSN